MQGILCEKNEEQSQKVFTAYGLILHIVKRYPRKIIVKLSVWGDKIHKYHNIRMFFQNHRSRNILYTDTYIVF